MIIGRRELIAGGAAFLYAGRLRADPAVRPSLLPTPPGTSLGFAVMRKGSKIGGAHSHKATHKKAS